MLSALGSQLIKSHWNLLDVLGLNAGKFFDTILEVRRIKAVIDSSFTDEDRNTVIDAGVLPEIREGFAELAAATGFIGAELASIAATRMADVLQDNPQMVRFRDVSSAVADVESRLRDECQLISFVVLNRVQKSYFGDANELVGDWDINRIFPDAARELEESAKCIALQRPTAAVFHAMRMLEIGVRKLAELLSIGDPTKPAERNWGNILRLIKERIDEVYPKSQRHPDSDGAAFEKMYASLDAVKNPWRNGTMHVETFYTESEAVHILRCVAFFMKTLAAYSEPENVTLNESDSPSGEPFQR